MMYKKIKETIDDIRNAVNVGEDYTIKIDFVDKFADPNDKDKYPYVVDFNVTITGTKNEASLT